MHLTNRIVALVLVPMLLVTSSALAQQTRIVDPAVLSEALATKAATEGAQRDLVRRVLDRDDVRDMAARMGFDVQKAGSAVATLSGSELSTLAQHASTLESEALAGGANTVVISVTTLLLILIIVILLAS